MNIKDFESKYGTGEQTIINPEVSFSMNGKKENYTAKIPGEKFYGLLGDLIKDYHDHLSMNFIDRWFSSLSKAEWNMVERKFRKVLNLCNFTWNDTKVS